MGGYPRHACGAVPQQRGRIQINVACVHGWQLSSQPSHAGMAANRAAEGKQARGRSLVGAPISPRPRPLSHAVLSRSPPAMAVAHDAAASAGDLMVDDGAPLELATSVGGQMAGAGAPPPMEVDGGSLMAAPAGPMGDPQLTGPPEPVEVEVNICPIRGPTAHPSTRWAARRTMSLTPSEA